MRGTRTRYAQRLMAHVESTGENTAMTRPKMPVVKIVVDVHERQSGIADTLAELEAEVETAPLPAGDYAVGADTLVERKRVLDLHAAVLKGATLAAARQASRSLRLPIPARRG